jgi:hypothetical protein
METTAAAPEGLKFGQDWSKPTTLQIASFLYTKTAKQKMKMAAQNIEKILVKLWMEGRVDAVGEATGVKVDVTERRYINGPPSWQEGVVWIWRGSSGGMQQSGL